MAITAAAIGTDASICDLTVSFVLYRTPVEEVARAVDQVLCEREIDSRIVIVDNSEPPLVLPAFDPDRVTVIATGSNLGYGRAHNIALNRCGSDAPYHVVMNTDIAYEPGTLSAMIAFMRTHPQAGLAMPRVTYPDGSLQTLCRLLPTPMDLIARRFLHWTNWGKAREHRYELRDWGYDAVASIPFLSGCFMVLDTAVLARVGGFDERYFLYGEDTDLSRRLHAASDALFNPDVTIVHDYAGRANFSFRRLLTLVINLSRYFNKWGWLIDRDRDRVNLLTLAALGLGRGEP
jgi:GT2 family glycosyltransferase